MTRRQSETVSLVCMIGLECFDSIERAEDFAWVSLRNESGIL